MYEIGLVQSHAITSANFFNYTTFYRMPFQSPFLQEQTLRNKTTFLHVSKFAAFLFVFTFRIKFFHVKNNLQRRRRRRWRSNSSYRSHRYIVSKFQAVHDMLSSWKEKCHPSIFLPFSQSKKWLTHSIRHRSWTGIWQGSDQRLDLGGCGGRCIHYICEVS